MAGAALLGVMSLRGDSGDVTGGDLSLLGVLYLCSSSGDVTEGGEGDSTSDSVGEGLVLTMTGTDDMAAL